MLKLNILSVIIIAVFILLLLEGESDSFSLSRIKYSLGSLMNSLAFLIALLLSLYLTRNIFFVHQAGIYQRIYNSIPINIREYFFGQDVMTYLIVVPLLLILLRALLGVLTGLFNKRWLDTISNGIFKLLQSMGSFLRRLIGAVMQLPRRGILVFVLGAR